MEDQLIFGVLWASMCALVAIRVITYRKMKKLVSKKPTKELFLVFIAIVGMGIIPLIYLTTGLLEPFTFRLEAEVRLFGAIMYALGLLLVFWVHHTLGHNWSPLLEIRREHMLVTGGPYRFVRHPLYLAFFTLAIGQTLFTANWVVAAGVLLWTFFYLGRVGDEENMMLEFFGRQYQLYMERTGRLLPKLRQ